MRKIEEMMRSSIRTDFKILDKDYTLENAIDMINVRKISTIIIEHENNDYFGYSIVTRKQIANSIARGIAINKTKIGNISDKVTSINHLELFENLTEILSSKKEIILVTDGDEVIGFIDVEEVKSKLEQKGIELNSLVSNFNSSDLDKFIRYHDDPVADIDEFYDILSYRGFNLTPDIKKYLKEKIECEIRNIKSYEDEMFSNGDAKEEEEEIGSEEADTDGKQVPDSERYRFAVIYHPEHILHQSEIPSPENPDRLLNVINLLKSKNIDIFKDKCKLITDYKPARPSDILRVHSRKYLEFVRAYSNRGGGFLGDSTYFTPHTYTIALQAAGGAIQAGNAVARDGFEFALALVRPPGHHATTDKYGGYCIFNNSAVLARYLQRKRKLSKIMIIDWDAHSANGTMQIFYEDPTVLVLSIHQDPHGFYPNTGFTEQMGRGKGLGYTVNVEMPKNAGDREMMLVMEKIVLPLYESYSPDFVIGCSGFDAHHKDTYTELKLTSKGYYNLSRILGQKMKNKLVILNEGGYHKFNGKLTYTMINGLLGESNPFNENYDSLTVSVTSSGKINKIVNERIALLIKLLSEYHSV